MAQTRQANTIVVTGAETVPGPVDIVGILNNATTSFTIADDGRTAFAGGAGTNSMISVPLRSASGFVVTVTGGGSVTLILRVSRHR